MEADFSQFEHLTDVMGSFQMIKRYSLISLYFKSPRGQTPSSQIAVLQQGLREVAQAFPWLAGKTVYEGRDETHTGIRRIVPYAGTIPLLQKDFSANDSFPTIDEVNRSGFPIKLLDPEKVVPSIARTWDQDGFDVHAPVLILQANFIRGGLILTICGNHTAMDMTGLGMVITWIAKACRGDPFAAKEVEEANQDRRNAIPLLDESYQPGLELDDSIIRPPPPGAPPMHIHAAKWTNINFTRPDSLTILKTAASAQSIAPYISTDDAISALLWQRITAARASLHPASSSTTTRLCRTVSMRHLLNLHGYTGHLVDCVYTSLASPHELSIGTVAGSVRATLRDEAKMLYHMRAFATMVDRLDDKTKIVSGAQLDPNVDVVVSSYANLRPREHDWGQVLGGKPLAARRPDMSPWPSLLNIMPRDLDGVVAVAVCLAEEEVEWLRRDEVLGQYAEVVG
jgi:trichothecene 3-O-acetyltransferase